jgi:hypothetical protein
MSFLWHGLTDAGAQVPIQVDAQGRVIAVDGSPGVSNWENTGTELYPLNNESVIIGGTLPASPNISLNANGTASFKSQAVNIDSSGRLLVGTSSWSGNESFVAFRSAGSGRIAIARKTVPAAASDPIGFLGFKDVSENNYAEISCSSDGSVTTGTATPGRLGFSTTAAGASAPTERMRISNDGNLTSFTSSNCTIRTARISATDSVFVILNGASSISTGTAVCLVRADGDLENANNSYGALSDIKLKENIVDASSQWADLKALAVRKYNFKAETGFGTHTQIGLVAQEAELVCPGLVSDSPDLDEDGKDLGTITKSINYSVLYMKAVKALQEAMDRIEELEYKVGALEAQ